MARRASSSQRSFSACPLWPRTHFHSMLCILASSFSRSHRSRLRTGSFLLFIHPFLIQPGSHSLIPLTRYWESVVMTTRQGRLRVESPSMAAVSSIRLLVVSGALPARSFSFPCQRRMHPQPPGPGLPLQAPSQKISTFVDIGPLFLQEPGNGGHDPLDNQLMGLLAVRKLKQVGKVECGTEDHGGPLADTGELPQVQSDQGGRDDHGTGV